MPETITREGSTLPIQVRTARKQHACNDCETPILPGDKYEYATFPPHSIDVWDVDHWLTWRNHYPRHDGDNWLFGCELAAAYAEKAEREQLEAANA